MKLTKLSIRNYRLLSDAELDIHEETTLIVGRNNTAKTSSIECVNTVLNGNAFLYDDYPLAKRKELHDLFTRFVEKSITYDDLCKTVPIISVEFLVDYYDDAPEDNLGALSPFIIDVDVDTTEALIVIENRLKLEESALRGIIEEGFYIDGAFVPGSDEARNTIRANFTRIFGVTISAVNPKDRQDRQTKTLKELKDLFPIYSIPAERILGEDGSQKKNTLSDLISSFFDVDADDLNPLVAKEIIQLRQIIEKANKEIQKNSDLLLSSVVNKSIGFGYPNAEELRLGVTTQLKIDDQIKNQTTLSYSSNTSTESLPSTHNGLGYKNLIKIQFLLATYAKEIQNNGSACIPLLFIEEPESHMHPQMQHLFADYLESFLKQLSNVRIQTILTSHSAHIANTTDFSKIRYAQKTTAGVIFKNLDEFAKANPDNLDFMYLFSSHTECRNNPHGKMTKSK